MEGSMGNICGTYERCGEGSAEESVVLSDSVEESKSTVTSSEESSSVNTETVSEKKIDQFDLGDVDKQKNKVSGMDMMKERFSKLLLGEDMSGCGKGVCTALAISNAITNLCGTIFGQVWRLEPLSSEKKAMWQREMEWLLCVSDHIVELTPSWQTFPDGSKLEVMTCRPRSDLHINLPALKKLDNMLLEILDAFNDPEFWYADQGILPPDDGSSSFRKQVPRNEEKWWLPVPRIPAGGLGESSRKELQHKRECTNQILKAAMAINSDALADMEVPESYLDSLPKNGRASLGDIIYRYITSYQFSPECLLDCLDFASEHQALEIANRVEAAMYIWRRRGGASRPPSTRPPNPNRSGNRSSWDVVKDMILDADRRELLAERAESLLICLKQRFPGLTQTTLDMSKIQFNKDLGKSILEVYSRVLESVAFNIAARIDDLLYVDDLTRQSNKLCSAPTTNNMAVVTHKRVPIPCLVPLSSTPYSTNYATPSFSPSPLGNPTKGERTPLINRRSSARGLGVKKVLTEYLGVDSKGKSNSTDTLVVSTVTMNSHEGHPQNIGDHRFQP